MKRRKLFLLLIVILLAAVLACKQSGQVFTVEEATRRAMPTPIPTVEPGELGDDTIEIGEQVILVGRSFLVNLLDGPDGRLVAGESRGTTVTVEQAAAVEGELWYQVRSSSGQVGWVKAENLEAKE
jgi:hypothetical protein